MTMAPHSSTLAWKTAWTEEPGGLQSIESWRVGHLLSDLTFTFHFHALEKEIATHSSVLAWRISGTGEPGGLPSLGSHSWTRLKRLSSRGLVGCFCPDLYVFSKNKYIKNSTRIKLIKFNIGADPQISPFILVLYQLSSPDIQYLGLCDTYQKNSLIFPIYIDRKQSVWDWISRAWNHDGKDVKLDKAEMGLQSTILNTMF